jgi:hypothetical protein
MRDGRLWPLFDFPFARPAVIDLCPLRCVVCGPSRAHRHVRHPVNQAALHQVPGELAEPMLAHLDVRVSDVEPLFDRQVRRPIAVRSIDPPLLRNQIPELAGCAVAFPFLLAVLPRGHHAGSLPSHANHAPSQCSLRNDLNGAPSFDFRNASSSGVWRIFENSFVAEPRK